MGLVESITAWGLPNAAAIVEIARQERLGIADACTVMEKESGGRNVWGSDGVPTGDFYRKGAPVTREAYLAWKPHRKRLGSQGVGPLQLTYPPLQDQADAIGGCWDWHANTRIGFRHLAQLQRQYGVRDGFRRYNGSGPMAERYAEDAMARLRKWQARLGTTTPAPVPPAPARPAPAPPRVDEEDDDMTPEDRERQIRIEQKLDLLVSQIVVGEGRLDDHRTWGWTTWGGGTNERLTPVDYWRRGNVETRVARDEINAGRAETQQVVNGLAKEVGELAAEVRALREGHVAGDVVLSTQPAIDSFEFTGTARITP